MRTVAPGREGSPVGLIDAHITHRETVRVSVVGPILSNERARKSALRELALSTKTYARAQK
jgi:hypothetical protein